MKLIILVYSRSAYITQELNVESVVLPTLSTSLATGGCPRSSGAMAAPW